MRSDHLVHAEQFVEQKVGTLHSKVIPSFGIPCLKVQQWQEMKNMCVKIGLTMMLAEKG